MFSTTPIILVLGLTVATCVIAYWSDNLGKKLGKKRLSLFGLRPRQTATVISMVTSVIIMLLTLAILLIFNASLRHALFSFDKVRKEANDWRKAAASGRRQADIAKGQLTQASAQFEKSKLQLGNATAQLLAETKKASDARERTFAARRELSQAQKGLTAAKRAEEAARRGQQAAKLAQSQAQIKAEQLLQQLSRSKEILGRTLDELTKNEEQLKARRRELQQVKVAARDLKEAGSRIVKSNSTLIRQAVALNAQITDLKKKREDLEALRKEAEKSFTEARDIALDYRGLVGALGAGKIAVGLGKVFAETTISAASDPAHIRTALRELLDAGAAEAESFGGKPFVPEGATVERALQLATRYRGESDQAVAITEDEQIEQISNYLATFKIPVSIRATAARNYAEGETKFFARLEIVPVKRAFVTGETITSSIIDGNATDAELFNQLLKLVNAGEVVARQRGVTPLVTKENPDFYAVGTNERIFDALRDAQMQAHQVRVRLVAAEDSTTVDNLRVRFVIERTGL